MNYTLSNIKIKSNWFDKGSKQTIYDHIGYKGLFLYFSLFKFRLYNQEHDYMFVTSISLLHKECRYTKDEIFELLKVMERLKLIKITNKTRWDQLLNNKKKVDEHRVLVVIAADVPVLKKEEVTFGQKSKLKDKPATDDDYYINVDLVLMQHYLDIGLDEKYFPIYCLMRKYENGNIEKKSFMEIVNMAEVLNYDKNVLNKMIHEMNRKYVLCSRYVNNGKDNKRFDHYICTNYKSLGKFKDYHKEQIEKNIKKWDRKKGNKNKVKVNSVECK